MLSGYNVSFVPGWDCHGLPIELNVEQKSGKPNKDIPAKDFRAKCRDYANQQIAIQKRILKDWVFWLIGTILTRQWITLSRQG